MENDDNIQVRLEKYIWPQQVREMKKKRNRKIVICLLAIAIFLSGWGLGSWLTPGFKADNQEITRFNEMYDIMAKQWYYSGETDFSGNDLINRAMKGMSSIDFDPYTEYFTPQELASFEQGVNQTYSGIGVEMNTQNDYPLIINVFYDTPAEKGGLKVGDYIVAVDGRDIKGMSYDELKLLVLGEAGTTVEITYTRGEKTVKVDLVRANISYTVTSKIIDKKIGYLEIMTFGSYTPNEVKHVLDEFVDRDVHKLIIDLRDNGGGYLDALTRIADFFLIKDATIFKQQYSNREVTVHKAKTSMVYEFDEIIILTNGNTASASEVLTSCLVDHGLAKTLGEKTFGKGTSQMIHTFSDGSALKYTQTHWLSANGKEINGQGIEPNYPVNLPAFLYMHSPELNDDEKIIPNQVSAVVAFIQEGLAMMEYSVDRSDGYFSAKTLKSLNDFQAKEKLTKTDYIDNDVYLKFLAACRTYYSANENRLDTQLAEAVKKLS